MAANPRTVCAVGSACGTSRSSPDVAGHSTNSTIELVIHDSGSSVHAHGDAKAFTTLTLFPHPQPLGLAAAGSVAMAHGSGVINWTWRCTDGSYAAMPLTTTFVPTFDKPIISSVRFAAEWNRLTHGVRSQHGYSHGATHITIHNRNSQEWLAGRRITLPQPTTHSQSLASHNSHPATTATITPTEGVWLDLSTTQREMIRAGRVCEPRMGRGTVAKLCDCTDAEARDTIRAADASLRHTDTLSRAPRINATSMTPPPPPPLALAPATKHNVETGPISKVHMGTGSTGVAPKLGVTPLHGAKSWSIADEDRQRLDNMSVDEMLRALRVPIKVDQPKSTATKPASTTNRAHDMHMRLRLARLGTYCWEDARDTYLRYHHLTGHSSHRRTSALLLRHGIKLTPTQRAFCLACALARSKKSSLLKHTRPHVSKDDVSPLTQFSGDVIGPLPVSRFGAFRFCAVFLSTHGTAYHFFLVSLQHFTKVIAALGEQIKRDLIDVPGARDLTMHMSQLQMKTDNASYFVGKESRAAWVNAGFRLRTSKPYDARYNGACERLIQEIKRRAAVMLLSTGNSHHKDMWPEAFRMALDVQDVLPPSTGGPSPYELRTSRLPDLSKLYPPFCRVTVWFPPTSRPNKNIPARVGCYLGRDRVSDTARVLISGELKPRVVLSHHIRYDDAVPAIPRHQWHVTGKPTYRNVESHDDDVIDIDAIRAQTTADQHDAQDNDTLDLDAMAANVHMPQATPAKLAVIAANMDADDIAFMRAMLSETANNDLHYNMRRAIACPKYGHLVLPAVKKEISGLITKGALVQIDASTVTSKVHKIISLYHPKFSNKDGSFVKYKNRCCVDGSTITKDRSDPDYMRTDTGQSRMEVWRLHIAAVPSTVSANGHHTPIIFPASDPLTMVKADISQAYIRAMYESPTDTPLICKFSSDVFKYMVEQDMAKTDASGSNAFEVKRSVYGVPSSGRAFESLLITWMVNQGFTQSKLERNLFYRTKGDPANTPNTPDALRVLIFTDDISCVGKTSVCNDFISELEIRFGDVGAEHNPSTILGWGLTYHNDGAVSLSASAHIQNLIEACELSNDYSRRTPMRAGLHYSKADRCESDAGVLHVAQKLCGRLLYIAQCARPDLSFTAMSYSTVSSSPPRSILQELQHTARYCLATKNKCLRYHKSVGSALNQFVVYCDASDGDNDKSCSTSGLIGYFNGAPLFWSSTKQKTTSLSTAESEVKAACHATREIVWLRAIANEMGFAHSSRPTRLFTDSEVAINWTIPFKSFTKKSKHLDRKYWYTREKLESGEITLEYENTTTMTADICTKNLGHIIHDRLCKMIFDPCTPPVAVCPKD